MVGGGGGGEAPELEELEFRVTMAVSSRHLPVSTLLM